MRHYLQHSKDIDMSTIIAKIAAKDPSLFVDFLEKVTGKSNSGLCAAFIKQHPAEFVKHVSSQTEAARAAELIALDLKQASPAIVPAIRKAREAWGLGLKEAKDLIVTVHQWMIAKKADPYASTSSFLNQLPVAHQQHAKQIMEKV